jgi:hypothetical protein
MSITTWVIIAIVILILLFVAVKFIKSCLPKIIIGVVILGALAYWYFTK